MRSPILCCRRRLCFFNDVRELHSDVLTHRIVERDVLTSQTKNDLLCNTLTVLKPLFELLLEINLCGVLDDFLLSAPQADKLIPCSR